MERILGLLEAAARLFPSDPMGAADRFDELGDLIKDYAARMRLAAQGHAPTSPGGVGDSCRMRASGPDGVVKSDTTTR